jgi:hypothetical protein
MLILGRAVLLYTCHQSLTSPSPTYTLPPPLTSPAAVGGAPALIRGSYEYCHYMQGRTNDAGWGCAYRSLQTIVTWFRLQRYTAKPVPSHREVQATLARLGDKDASFVGSSQWIGAIELGYILDDHLGVTCKVRVCFYKGRLSVCVFSPFASSTAKPQSQLTIQTKPSTPPLQNQNQNHHPRS